MDQKWRVVASQTLLKDRWIDVRADHCISPSGHEIAPYYVLNYPDWVHVVAITPDEQVVLVRQYRHGGGAFFVEPPGGVMDKGDAEAEITARRELLEETGYTAAHWQEVAVLHANPGMQTNRLHIFLAREAMLACEQRLDPGEDGLTVHLLPVAELLAEALAGRVSHSMHVSVLLLGLAAAGYLHPAAR